MVFAGDSTLYPYYSSSHRHECHHASLRPLALSELNLVGVSHLLAIVVYVQRVIQSFDSHLTSSQLNPQALKSLQNLARVVFAIFGKLFETSDHGVKVIIWQNAYLKIFTIYLRRVAQPEGERQPCDPNIDHIQLNAFDLAKTAVQPAAFDLNLDLERDWSEVVCIGKGPLLLESHHGKVEDLGGVDLTIVEKVKDLLVFGVDPEGSAEQVKLISCVRNIIVKQLVLELHQVASFDRPFAHY